MTERETTFERLTTRKGLDESKIMFSSLLTVLAQKKGANFHEDLMYFNLFLFKQLNNLIFYAVIMFQLY